MIGSGGMNMGKFVIRTVASGVKFDLRAGNGEVIATSEVYDSRAACHKGVESVRKIAAAGKVDDLTAGEKPMTNPKFEVYEDKRGGFRFRMKSRNGQIVAVSEGYTTLQACLDGVESVCRNAPDGEIEE